MKKLILVVLCLDLVIFTPVLFQGCSTTEQKKAFATLGALEATTTAAVDGYYTLVIQGKVATNDVPRVGDAYNKFQETMQVMIDFNQGSTNALSPESLILQAREILNLIEDLKGNP